MRRFAVLLCATALVAATGCVSQKEFNAVVSERDQLRTELNESKKKVSTLESDLERVNTQFDEATKKIAELAKQNSEFASEKAKLEARITTLTEDLAAAEGRAKKAELAALEADARIKKAQAQISTLQAMKSKAGANIAAVRVEGEKIQIQIQNLLKAVKALDAVLAEEIEAPPASESDSTQPDTSAPTGDAE